AQLRAIEGIQRAQLRAIRDAVTAERVAERLHAGSITPENEPLLPGVPDREGEHSMQAAHHLWPVTLVQVYEHLRVAARGETVSRSDELTAQLMMVVDLSVEDDGDGSILIADR